VMPVRRIVERASDGLAAMASAGAVAREQRTAEWEFQRRGCKVKHAARYKYLPEFSDCWTRSWGEDRETWWRDGLDMGRRGRCESLEVMTESKSVLLLVHINTACGRVLLLHTFLLPRPLVVQQQAEKGPTICVCCPTWWERDRNAFWPPHLHPHHTVAW
jgi:hypothetical protein